jgi:serine phosphatase RsbU (regulator of sigma subunit)
MQDRALKLLPALQLDREDYNVNLRITANNALLHRAIDRLPASQAFEYLRNEGVGHTWTARLTEREPASVSLQFGEDEAERRARRLLAGDLSFTFDMQGALTTLSMPVSDSVELPDLNSEQAYHIIRSFLIEQAPLSLLGPLPHLVSFPHSLRDVSDFAGIEYVPTPQPRRQDHRFSWVVYNETLGDSLDVHATCAGNMVTKFGYDFRSITNDAWKGGTGLVDILEIIVFAMLIVTLLVVGFRRLRTDEIGFRSALVVGIGTAVLFALWMYVQVFSMRMMDAEIVVVLLLAPLMVGAGITLLWAVSESVGRDAWREKFISFDLTTRGHLLHSRVGSALLTGCAAGAALLLTGLFAAWGMSFWQTVWLPQSGNDGANFLTSALPAIFLSGEAMFSNLAGFSFFLLFFVSLLSQRLRRTWMVVAAGSLTLTIVDLPNLLPLPEAWFVQLPVIVLLVLLFIRTDVLTTLAAMVTLTVLQQGMVFFLPFNPAYHDQGLILALLFTFIVVYAFITIVIPDRDLDFEAIAPRFQRHISERQRLARELEIARDVQMSFLPRRTPQTEGLDIAAHCAPALEVGGDYYDFIDIAPGQLGIAIGDVSGKGTQAAFYMTLTKGFLKALGAFSASPSEVLTRLNRLFYDNVDRGHFISMVYAVFDENSHKVTIVRAGHTPVIRRCADASVAIVQSRGMALGFESGKTFSSTIEEVTFPLLPGDMFVFYTDGYPEAMTKTREEYGEARLMASIERFSGTSAQDLLDHLFGDTVRFTGKAQQHDDMSMVVVRIQ